MASVSELLSETSDPDLLRPRNKRDLFKQELRLTLKRGHHSLHLIAMTAKAMRRIGGMMTSRAALGVGVPPLVGLPMNDTIVALRAKHEGKVLLKCFQ